MEKAYKAGKVRAIGLSSFTAEQVQEILDKCEVKPAGLIACGTSRRRPFQVLPGPNKKDTHWGVFFVFMGQAGLEPATKRL